MIAYTLFSGSTGNSIFVKNGSDEILIDAGKSATAIEKALLQAGTCLSNIKAIFLTHEHSDHTKGVGILARKFNIPIYAESWYDANGCP